ncbi:MAG: UDP-N-acetylmuramate--L-alanine ligase [Oscillospiraceae bacterium]|nr:UDP-N-acetylmuramate--L-alanine ligase [Oscillospiraceae bacterium]
MENFLAGKKHIHFIGIGGSGMYPLAQILHTQGYYLTGSDNNETATLDAVRKMGIPVFLGHDPKNLEGADLVVHTAAIMADNPELCAAKASGVLTIERSELLGLVTSWYSKAFCVSGTHGKTTTSSMLTHILLAAGIDMSAVIGGKLKAIGGSGRAGKSEYMVCEACEFVDTFLKLFPDISVILNIDRDHMDYFKTMENLKLSFSKFCKKTTDMIIANGEDENTMDAVRDSGSEAKVITFGKTSACDFWAENIRVVSDFHTDFTLMYKGEALAEITIHVPGLHNVYNAVAACAAAYSAGIPAEALRDGLDAYNGTVRRFERIAEVNGITVADDYAHHPAEVAATLRTAKGMSFRRVWAVHQPFTYSRTAMLLDEFAEALSVADKVTLTEIMGSREKNTYNIYAKDLAEKIDDCEWYATFEEVAEKVAAEAQAGDLIITLGCGDVYKVAEMIAEKLRTEAI